MTVKVKASTLLGDEVRELDVESTAQSGEVARGLSESFMLPANTPWSLRSATTGAFLKDEDPIGAHADPNGAVEVTVTPRAHLG